MSVTPLMGSANFKIGLIDYGMGNIQSVKNVFARAGAETEIVQTPEAVLASDALILPGVGAFGKAMENLTNAGLIEGIKLAVKERKRPLLGICLGMQLLVDDSEERGRFRGLGLIPGSVKKIPVTGDLRLPLIGWNTLEVRKSEPIFSNVVSGEAFYFVHSFHVECEPQYCSAVSDYGGPITAAIQRDRVFGVQFHPEKSQSNGLRLVKSFIEFARTTKES